MLTIIVAIFCFIAGAVFAVLYSGQFHKPDGKFTIDLTDTNNGFYAVRLQPTFHEVGDVINKRYITLEVEVIGDVGESDN